MLISVGAISTISSAKRPSQHFLFSILPYLTQLSKISFLNKLNNIRDSGQLCLTPQLIGNSSDVIFR